MSSLRIYLLALLFLSLGQSVLRAQDDSVDSLLNALGSSVESTERVRYTFKSTRIINLHSNELAGVGALVFRIAHRFNDISGGMYDLFGLDGANIRFALEYGISDRFMVALGRNNFLKTGDALVKVALLRQTKGEKNFPFSATFAHTSAFITQKAADKNRKLSFLNRMSFTNQIVLTRKFNEAFSLALVPSWVHENTVPLASDLNDIFAMGVGARFKLSSRVSLNGEYIYRLPSEAANIQYYANSLSLGFDIETGGHVFQLHLTNSAGMTENRFIAFTDSRWTNSKAITINNTTRTLQQNIFFGFNITRDFALSSHKQGKHDK
ncbi:MAG: hypothetical protein EAZ57_02900 [Cytophagales bacterium]|nr:MAG: hypothetical protein EAZ67_03365 [Cytophagales bacterium]TAF61707.1 MAG: hypothetical protein EAZ57_02900 [Cytophagales bacterium]